jgi:hypothetical protein
MVGEGLGYLSGLSSVGSPEAVGCTSFSNAGKSKHVEKCWKDLFMSPDRRSYFPFWIGENPRQSFMLKYEIIPSFQFFAAFMYSSLVFQRIMPEATQGLSCFIAVTPFSSAQSINFQFPSQTKICILLIFVFRQKPSAEC